MVVRRQGRPAAAIAARRSWFENVQKLHRIEGLDQVREATAAFIDI
jgi:hypothetical protein